MGRHLTGGPDLVAAIDVGTSGAKAGLFDADGREVASAVVEYEPRFPAPGWAESSADEWWSAAATAMGSAIDRSGRSATDIAAVGVTGQGPSCLPLDAHGDPMRPAITWMDRRADAEARMVVAAVGTGTAERISGNRVDGSFGGPKWLWLARREPELFARTAHLVQANGYIAYRLTGEIATDDGHAAICAPFYDLAARRWSEDLLGAGGIPVHLLPPIVPATEVIGHVRAASASLTGLAAGTPVVAGGADAACSVLGAGVVQPGSFVQMLGTSGNLMGPVRRHGAPDTRLVNTVHLTGDDLVSGTTYAGGVLQWFHAELGQVETAQAARDGRSVYAVLDDAAAAVPAGAEGVLMLPYLLGDRTPHWDPWARGAFFGLTPFHTRAHMYRAALEGVAFAMRTLLDVIEEGGQRVNELVSVDGGGSSDLWRQIFADVLRVPIRRTARRSSALLGAAVVAGVGVGLLPDLRVVEQWPRTGSLVEPDPARVARYRELHALHERLYVATTGLSADLAALATQPDRPAS